LNHLEKRLQELPITEREKEIAWLVVKGHSNAEIAVRCNITEHTVKDHLKSVYRKTGVRQRTALQARLMGLDGSS